MNATIMREEEEADHLDHPWPQHRGRYIMIPKTTVSSGHTHKGDRSTHNNTTAGTSTVHKIDR